MQGAVALSYVLILFYAYCWIGPRPIRRLRTVRIFYLVYGIICFAWWGIFGTLEATTATSSGFQSCLSLSPSLYLVSQYEVAVFWILLLLFVGFAVMEKTAELREQKLAQWRGQKLDKARQAQELAEAEIREKVLEAAQEAAREMEEQQRKQHMDQREQLYAESDGEADEEAAEEAGDGAEEEEGGQREDANEEEDEEEEVLLDT